MKYLDVEPLSNIKTPDQVKAIPMPSKEDYIRYAPDGSKDEPASYYAWKSAAATWYSNFASAKKNAMDQCKAMFEKLQDAVSTTQVYVISYEHSIEAIDFSYKQIEKARNSMNEIEDNLSENFENIKKSTDDTMKENQELAKVLIQKKEKLESFAQVLNDLSESVIELNEWWDNTPLPSLDFPY